MSPSERTTCERCGQPMFHLAQVCPHCGARRAGAPPAEEAVPRKEKPAPLSLSPEEARALLAVQSPAQAPKTSLVEVAKDLVLPRAGVFESVASLLAAPLTVASVAALALALLRERRTRREEGMRGAALLAVPATAALLAVLFFPHDAGVAWYVGLGACAGAWLIRSLGRARADGALQG
ncbi:MAG: hypothetical protein AMXMBFR34_36970 [Myxococcaceae bacterium]